MSFNGSGTYTAPSLPGSFNPAVSGQSATPADFNTLLDDIESALSSVICKDGQTTVTANLPMATRRHTGVGNAAARTDYAAAGQVSDNAITYAADTGSATAYAIALTPAVAAYVVGAVYTFKATNANSGTTPTLAVNGLTAGTITWPNGTALAAGNIAAGSIVQVACAAVSSGTPTWHLITNTPPVVTIAIARRQVFSASNTYTPHADMVTCLIEVVGGGGGGGGVAGNGQSVAAGAGGAGGYSSKICTAADIGASKTVTIGAAGAAGASGNNAGGAGGDTSVGVLCVGKGGSGGGGGANVQPGTPGAGGVAGTGDVAATGQPGGPGMYAVATSVITTSFSGGSSPFGGGAPATIPLSSTLAGNAATGYGAGGGGAASHNVASNAAGGAGTAGFVVITEYCSK